MNHKPAFLGPVSLRRRLGQDIITSYDEGTAVDIPGLITTYDQGPTFDVPGLVSTYDQGTASPVPGIVVDSPYVPDQKPAGMNDTDWAKLLGSAITAAASGYSTYSKAEIAKINSQAAALRSSNPTAAALLPGTGLSTGEWLVIGGLAAGTLILVAALA